MASKHGGLQPESPPEAGGGERDYLLRCWREGQNWRFSVRAVGPEQRRFGFGDLQKFVAWLQQELEGGSP